MAIQGNLTIRNARIIFRNFSGQERKFNPAGARNFHVILDTDLAERLKAENWNIKYLQSRDEEEEPVPHMKVTVKYSERSAPPLIVLKTSKNAVRLNESRIGQLDAVEIQTVNMVIRPYHHQFGGVTGYLKSMEVTINEDEIESRYSNLDDELPFDEDEE